MEGVWQRCDTAHDPKDWRWSAGKGKAWGTAWWHIRGRRSDLFYKLSGGSWGAGCGHPWKSPWGWFWVNVRSHFEKERLLSWSLFSGAWRILSLHLIKYRPGSAWQDCRAQGRLWSVFVLRGLPILRSQESKLWAKKDANLFNLIPLCSRPAIHWRVHITSLSYGRPFGKPVSHQPLYNGKKRRCSFIQQRISKHLLCARHCFSLLDYIREQNRQTALLSWVLTS